MKFLVDESVSWRFARELRDAGYDAVHVDQLGLPSAADVVVFRAAADNARHIITQDIDFETLLLSSGRAMPSIILLRISDGRAKAQSVALLASLGEIRLDIEGGAIVVLEDNHIRVHRIQRT